MFTQVCCHRIAAMAEMARIVLEEHGLHPLPLNYSANVSFKGNVQGYFLEVPDQEADLARTILSKNNQEKYIVRAE
jgi:hypothetical protein